MTTRIGELLLPEVEAEMARARKVLERVLNDRLDWRAPLKSRSIDNNVAATRPQLTATPDETIGER